MTDASATLTPPELARRWRVKPSKVLGFIRSGELRAFDVSSRPGGRPRFRIAIDAVIEFENRRAPKPVPKTRQRKQSVDVIEYF